MTLVYILRIAFVVILMNNLYNFLYLKIKSNDNGLLLSNNIGWFNLTLRDAINADARIEVCQVKKFLACNCIANKLNYRFVVITGETRHVGV